MLVDTHRICAAIQDVFEDTRAVLEPAGALAVAGMKEWVARQGGSGRELVAITSGANMDFARLRHVAERADIGARGEALFAVRIPELPGSFLRYCRTLCARNVTEFNYRYADAEHARIYVGVGIDAAEERDALRADIAGIQVPPTSDAAFAAHLAALGYPFVEETANPAYAAFL